MQRILAASLGGTQNDFRVSLGVWCSQAEYTDCLHPGYQHQEDTQSHRVLLGSGDGTTVGRTGVSPSHGAEAAHQEDVQSERSGLQPPLGPAGAAGTHQAWVRWGGATEGLFPPLSTCSEFQTCPAPQQRLPTLLVLFQKNRSPLSLARALLPQCSLQTQGLHRCHPDGVRHYPAGFRRGRSRLCLRARLCPSFFFVPCHVVRLVGSRRQL